MSDEFFKQLPDDPEQMKAYTGQIRVMGRRALEWRKANPKREALVQFNYPRKIMMIVPISEAVESALVSTNDAGLDLVKSLWPWGDNKEPTVFMVRMALEGELGEPVLSHQIAETHVCPMCGHVLDGATGLNCKTKPKPVDLTLCVYCRSILQFEPGGKLRRFTESEYRLLNNETKGVLSAALEAIKRAGKPPS